MQLTCGVHADYSTVFGVKLRGGLGVGGALEACRRPSGAAGDAPADRSERNGRKVGKAGKDIRRLAQSG